MKKLYYYPSAPRGSEYGNPYSINYKNAISRYFKVLNMPPHDKVKVMYSLNLFRYVFCADVFILNWIESISNCKAGYIQYWIVRLCLFIIRMRHKKIIWMLHNIHPHECKNKYSDNISAYLFKYAYAIITHSRTAAEYAETQAKCNNVMYLCHPITPIENIDLPKEVIIESFDVLIWGSVVPYKGIIEFISNDAIKKSNLKIRIIGKCVNKVLDKNITSLCTENIRYENRKADFSELQNLMRHSKYVLFPYVGDSVSSSGALIDTIALGGTPVGPNTGSFKDLSSDNLCLIYNSYNELANILNSNRSLDCQARSKFINENSWESFARKLYEIVEK